MGLLFSRAEKKKIKETVLMITEKEFNYRNNNKIFIDTFLKSKNTPKEEK